MLLRFFQLKVVWFAVCSLFLGPGVPAQQARELETPPASPVDSYPNSDVGLSDLLNDILTAARSGDRAALKSQIEDTKIPDYQNWFVRVYGEKRGHSIADFYGEWWERREQVFMELFLHLAHQEGRIVVQPFNFNEIHPSPQLSFDAYLADWEEPGATNANMVGQIGYFFIFVDGRFRWDCILQRHSDVVEHPRCQHMPSPPYPREANGAQGVVLINAVVNEDGSVTVQNIEKGDPILAKAAVESVREWRCEPALVDGWRPIAQHIVFEIDFKLSSPSPLH
jgi:TonB family protein